jgi:alkylation response protein AidB-like acyl-CoA dehydrogenase
MDFAMPQEISKKLDELDAFITAEIAPLEQAHPQYFDHRREHARTDWDNDGQPRPEWEALLSEMRRRADAAGHLRFSLPRELGGQEGSNLAMAAIREHLAAKGLGLHNDLQNESSVVGNFPLAHMMWTFGTDEQKDRFVEGMITGEIRVAFGLTEPDHGSDATWLETSAVRDGDTWLLNGAKRFNTGLHHATHDLIFARINMPTDHAEVTLRDVRVPGDAILHQVDEGLVLAQHFVHENRIRQAASGVGAAQYCIDASVQYARERVTFGKPLATNQAIQFPLAELQTECEMVRNLVYKTAWGLDRRSDSSRVAPELSAQVSMANYRANRLICEAADRAIQVHGGVGYSRHKPFEHIYRHHRRYRITEGSDEIQLRRIAGHLFGFTGRG